MLAPNAELFFPRMRVKTLISVCEKPNAALRVNRYSEPQSG